MAPNRFLASRQYLVLLFCCFILFSIFYTFLLALAHALFLHAVLYFALFSISSKKLLLHIIGVAAVCSFVGLFRSCEWKYQSTRLSRRYGLYLKNIIGFQVLSLAMSVLGQLGGTAIKACDSCGSELYSSERSS
ncbi:hypothetical protein BX070DRAFT_44659 [Coemansia spiralis]|nr:hypothetical protein BX070DRAFT_44659 [Coemansia spiralis]